jgi:hypothetical protein
LPFLAAGKNKVARCFSRSIVLAMGLGTYTQSTEQRRLSGTIERRGAQTGLSTLGMFAFGLPFAGIGAFTALVGLKVVPTNPASVHAPFWVLTAFGVVFALGGVMLWSMAWRQYQSDRLRASALERHVNEPALEDYNWDPRGFGSHCWAKTAKGIGLTGFMAIFLSIFNWWAWFAPGPLMVKIIVSLFDLILVFMCCGVMLAIARAFKFGNSRIEFVRFPYRANEQIIIRWLIPGGINRANKGNFTLRCVKEWTESSGSGNNRSTYIVHEEQWSGTWSLDQPEEFLPGKNVELEFTPAPESLRTCLSTAPVVFWEFEVNLDLPGPDFKETYLVPVY